MEEQIRSSPHHNNPTGNPNTQTNSSLTSTMAIEMTTNAHQGSPQRDNGVANVEDSESDNTRSCPISSGSVNTENEETGCIDEKLQTQGTEATVLVPLLDRPAYDFAIRLVKRQSNDIHNTSKPHVPLSSCWKGIPDNMPTGLLPPDQDLLWDGIVASIAAAALTNFRMQSILVVPLSLASVGSFYLVWMFTSMPGWLASTAFLLVYSSLMFSLIFWKSLCKMYDSEMRKVEVSLGPFLRSTAGLNIKYNVKGKVDPSSWSDNRDRFFTLSRHRSDSTSYSSTRATDDCSTTVPAPLVPPNDSQSSKGGIVLFPISEFGGTEIWPTALRGHTDINLFAWAHVYCTTMRVTQELRTRVGRWYFSAGFVLWVVSILVMLAKGTFGAFPAMWSWLLVLICVRVAISQTYYSNEMQKLCLEAVEKAAPAFTRSCGYGVVFEAKPGALFGTAAYLRMYPLNSNNNNNNSGDGLVYA